MAQPLIDTLKPQDVYAGLSASDVVERLGQSQSAQEDAARLSEIIQTNEAVSALLRRLFAASPFLAGIIENRPGIALSCLNGDPDQQMQELIETIWLNVSVMTREADVMAYLRQAREHAALLIALSDLGGRWRVMTVTKALSDFADAIVSATVNWLLQTASTKGDFKAHSQNNPSQGCGYVVLAMGKLGAHELNYSSDIDLIVLYDPETAPLADNVEPSTFFVRLTRALARMLHEQTADGYVFRVDLRLRPDPGATAVAISLEAAGQYYESMGQNWERAAMIKARAIAGDEDVAQAFLSRLVPFIWRKHLDFAAINDIHSMKRQINSHKGLGQIAVAGHNIKLGRGGIREIEFFAQTQQLIAGGRVPELRTQETLKTLEQLSAHNWITPETVSQMHDAYVFLREIEHRLQMIDDAQTHTLPQDEDALTRFAHFAGFADTSTFAGKLIHHLENVQTHYAILFEDAPDLGGETGSLVFTGGDDDPDTLETLTGMGFEKPSIVSAAIRAWHFGRYPATRSARAREILTELMPHLLATLAKSANPDAAFGRFDNFLRSLPAGVQLFSLLRANSNLLDLLASIMGTAPRLAETLSDSIGVLDAVLDPGFFSQSIASDDLERQCADLLSRADAFEVVLDKARVFAHDQMFSIGVALLSATLEPEKAGAAYTQVADVIIRNLLKAVAEEIERQHGKIKGGQIAVLAMGRLGSAELTATSDLDLMVIYDFDDTATKSDGPRPLDPVTYYSRFAQRLISALSVPTAEGALYEVDLRLRPSGRSGPIATRLSSFEHYQLNSAWTWEHMSLTRARVVAGNEELHHKITNIIDDTLHAKRDAKVLATDVLDMRKKIEQEKPASGPWDVKLVRGGLLDIEFICQYLQLAHGEKQPDALHPNTGIALARLAKAGVLNAGDGAQLLAAYQAMAALLQVLRLCVGEQKADALPDDLKKLLSKAVDEPEFDRIETMLHEHQQRVALLYTKLIQA